MSTPKDPLQGPFSLDDVLGPPLEDAPEADPAVEIVTEPVVEIITEPGVETVAEEAAEPASSFEEMRSELSRIQDRIRQLSGDSQEEKKSIPALPEAPITVAERAAASANNNEASPSNIPLAAEESSLSAPTTPTASNPASIPAPPADEPSAPSPDPIVPAALSSAPVAPAPVAPAPVAPEPVAPTAPAQDPFANPPVASEPVAPVAPAPVAPAQDPFAAAPAQDPFANPPAAPAVPAQAAPMAPAQDPFAAAPAQDPFANPPAAPAAPAQDPMQPLINDDINYDPLESEEVYQEDPEEDFEMNLNLPDDSPMSDANDYTPAYADIDSDSAKPIETRLASDVASIEMAPSVAPPAPLTPVDSTAQNSSQAPIDILAAIAFVDPDTQEGRQAVSQLSGLRTESQELGKGRRGKVTLDPLPFDSLVRGTPLIGTIYSPSGGVGKSSTAMNLAAYIANTAAIMAKKKMDKGEEGVRVPRVVVVDGDLVRGSLSLRLAFRVSPSIHDLMTYLDEREDQGIRGQDRWPTHYDDAPPGEKSMRDFVMWRTDMPNLNLLAAPEEPDLFYDFGEAEYREILQLLGKFYDVIIIDSGTEIIMDSQRSWLQHAHEVFLITAPEVDRIYNAAKDARYIAKSRPHPKDIRDNPPLLPPLATPDKISLVMTRYDLDSGLDPETVIDDYFKWLSKDRRFFVPDFSREILKANNAGEFLVRQNSEYAKMIGQLAKHLFSRYDLERQKELGPPL
jgi:MinD-like ATPase involved in chromosome partitioning or flagellar assembly